MTGSLLNEMILPVRDVKSWPTSIVDVDGVHAAIAYNDNIGIEKVDVSKRPFSIVEWIKSYLREYLLQYCADNANIYCRK